MKVSICVPTYEMKGMGDVYLKELIESVITQDYTNYEIIISDNSKDDILENLVKEYPHLNLHYYKNIDDRKSISANLNNAIRNSTGDVIDFLLQDDYYSSQTALSTRVKNLDTQSWGLTSTMHLNNDTKELYWHLIPAWRDDIYLGYNTVGSPSVLTVKKENILEFDESLFMLTDCDYYKQLHMKYGEPNISEEVTVISRIWPGQCQNDVDSDKLEEERKIVRLKFDK